jgi:hypothetical protein
MKIGDGVGELQPRHACKWRAVVHRHEGGEELD